jgi:serine protease AprX
MVTSCSICGSPTEKTTLTQVNWLDGDTLNYLANQHPDWQSNQGACPACVQQALLEILLQKGDFALHSAIQKVWPLDAEAAFGAIPTPLRMHADPRYSGKGVTLALIDAGFYPHPDLINPSNRIRAWADASQEEVQVRYFSSEQIPYWLGWDAHHPSQWHGLMTSSVAAGNGWLSHGFYRGLASQAELVLIQVRDQRGAITNQNIARALNWLEQNLEQLKVRVINLSVAGDAVSLYEENPVDEAVARLVDKGVVVVAAAGNNGERQLIPPATAPAALTVGGLDDQNLFEDEAVTIWHSNYGAGLWGVGKPEVVAPSIWVVAPVLPGSELADVAQHLFAKRPCHQAAVEEEIARQKLITPYYQHVDGTSFAAPLVSSVIACMLEANPVLTPTLIREILIKTAHALPEVSQERQGAGAVQAARATGQALLEKHNLNGNSGVASLQIGVEGVNFLFHHHNLEKIAVLGSWNGWAAPGISGTMLEPGIWQMHLPALPPGHYLYKFLLNEKEWSDDPANPHKTSDGFGGLNNILNVVSPT